MMSIAAAHKDDDAELRDLLIAEASRGNHDLEDDWTHARYSQHDNPDALTDAWVEKGTSYVWRVGVLAIWDANKCDWCSLAIGHRKGKTHQPEFIGILNWSDGENDDPARTVERALGVASWLHPVFDANR